MQVRLYQLAKVFDLKVETTFRNDTLVRWYNPEEMQNSDSHVDHLANFVA